MLNGDLHDVSVAVEFRRNENGALCWCDLKGPDSGRQPSTQCVPESTFTREGNQNAFVNAVRIGIGGTGAVLEGNDWIRVRVKGDFIRGRHHVTNALHGVDADHLPDWLPARRSGDGVEGGTFESWFRIQTND